MSSFSDALEQAGAVACAFMGDVVTVHQTQSDASVTDIATFGIPEADSLTPRDTNERRSLEHELVVAVPKQAVGFVHKGDRVSFPSSWVNVFDSNGDPTTLKGQIASVREDRSAPDVWLLALTGW